MRASRNRSRWTLRQSRQRLTIQLKNLNVSFTDDFESALRSAHHVIDAVFGMTCCSCLYQNLTFPGFSFSGEIREPFSAVISALESTSVPVTSIDAPSSWNIEGGPPESGPGAKFYPATLVSLTAPKPLVKFFSGRHFLGGRYLIVSMQTW